MHILKRVKGPNNDFPFNRFFNLAGIYLFCLQSSSILSSLNEKAILDLFVATAFFSLL